MERIFICAMIGAFVLAATAAVPAGSVTFTAVPVVEDPFEYGGGASGWTRDLGLADAGGLSSYGLRIEKTAPLAAWVAAGAVLQGLEGRAVGPGETVGFDIRADSPCGGGSPRFNLWYTTAEGVPGLVFLGCSEGTKAAVPDANWQRVTFGLDLPAGSVLNAVVLLVDEPGFYVVDNIRFGEWVANAPAPVCPVGPDCPDRSER